MQAGIELQKANKSFFSLITSFFLCIGGKDFSFFSCWIKTKSRKNLIFTSHTLKWCSVAIVLIQILLILFIHDCKWLTRTCIQGVPCSILLSWVMLQIISIPNQPWWGINIVYLSLLLPLWWYVIHAWAQMIWSENTWITYSYLG